jgi:hypothetical protein
MDDQVRNQPMFGCIPQPIRKDGAGGIDCGPRDVMRDMGTPRYARPSRHRCRIDPQYEVLVLGYPHAVKPRRLVPGDNSKGAADRHDAIRCGYDAYARRRTGAALATSPISIRFR